MIEILVSPCSPAPYPKRWAGLFEARVGDRLVCTSRQPLLDAARVLVAEGLDPDSVIVMRHAGSGTVALSSKLGVAARLTVREDKTALTSWKARPRDAGTRVIGETLSGVPGQPPDSQSAPDAPRSTAGASP